MMIAHTERSTVADHPNVDRCRRMYETFNAGDSGALRAMLSPDITWNVPGRGRLAGPKHGHDELFEFFERVGWQQSETRFHIDLRDVVADDDHMVAVVHFHHERDDAVFDQDGVELYRLAADGRIAEFWAFVHDSRAFDEFFG